MNMNALDLTVINAIYNNEHEFGQNDMRQRSKNFLYMIKNIKNPVIPITWNELEVSASTITMLFGEIVFSAISITVSRNYCIHFQSLILYRLFLFQTHFEKAECL